jgi:hypothetical protein
MKMLQQSPAVPARASAVAALKSQAAQSPKSVTPEKKKYPVPVNKLNAHAMSRK